jgi:hypothetical protein
MKTRSSKPQKAEKVKTERGYSPDEVVALGKLLSIEENKNYTGQNLEHYWFENYVWTVAVRIESDELITAYKNRKKKKELKL